MHRLYATFFYQEKKIMITQCKEKKQKRNEIKKDKGGKCPTETSSLKGVSYPQGV